MDDLDAIVVGAGANGLACALVLARAGLRVHVLEDRPAAGGGLRNEFPFAAAPRLAASTGSHRIGFVPRDLLRLLGVSLPLRPRDPCMFVPTTSPGRFLLAGPGHEAFRAAARSASVGAEGRDARALDAMHEELDAIVTDLAPAWTSGALGVEETAERFVRAPLREKLVALCRGSIGDYVDRFGVESDLVKAAIAADALSGTFGTWTSPGTGAALLVSHAARGLAGGADAIPEGGTGALVRALEEAALAAGVTIATGSAVAEIEIEGNTAVGVILRNGERLRAPAIASSADPMRLRAMIGDARLPSEYVRRIDCFARRGSVAKVNLALSALPRFAALPEERGQHAATIHLVPDAGQGAVASLVRAFEEASDDKLPAAPPIELVFPSATAAAHGGTGDEEGHHHASLLVAWAPYDLAGTTWAAEEERWLKQTLGLVDAFAPGTSDLVVDAFALSPKKLEAHFGVTRGHVHHVDDALIFGDRLACTTPIGGLYACGAGCAPAGGAFAVPGHNAAKRIIADLELALERTEVGRKS